MSTNTNSIDADSFDYTLHPTAILTQLATKWNLEILSEEFSKKLDESGIWPTYRNKFFYPKKVDLSPIDLKNVQDNDEESIYLCGNSLGLQPKAARDKINIELDKWAKSGVFGHFEGDLPWAFCEDSCRPLMAKLVGASTDEVNVMNFLSVNIHLMMISFYEPVGTRNKILLEDKAFPSDHYIVESQIRLHDLKPEECMVCLKPRDGEFSLRTEDIIKAIEEQGDEIALVLLSGVQYYTGQLFDIEKITKAAQEKGCKVGWDLAHAIGNVELKLHDWNVDFAAWCTYKYLNSGAGSIGAVFIHEKHFDSIGKMKKLDGWWSHNLKTRFQMSNHMEYAKGASAYALSNASMLLCSCLMASLEIFDEVGMKKLRQKSLILTGYLEYLLEAKFNKASTNGGEPFFRTITPKDPFQRGSQLSLLFSINVEEVFQQLEKHGIVCDERKPNVLRFAPTALYNTFSEIHRFVEILAKIINSIELKSA